MFSKQYLNCKILHGGTLLQPWPNAFGLRNYFSEIDVILLSKLSEDQIKKKVFAGNWTVFSSKLGEDQKKGLRRNLGPYSAETWDLFVLPNCFSSEHRAPKSRRVDA